jgi:hypothetical protein
VGASDLHDRSPEAVRQRLAYWQRRGREEARERTVAPRAKRDGFDVGKLASRVLPKPGDLAGAARHPRSYARQNPVPAAVLLFTGLVGLAVLRRGELPNSRGLISIGTASFVVALAASFAPDFVMAVLGLALLVAVLESADAISTVVGLASARFSEALGG